MINENYHKKEFRQTMYDLLKRHITCRLSRHWSDV